ncbi:hypothetical protein KJ765_01880 [Candidatus Micrarchaeota archaeon]|nr:hypothetical protein [Candidatus Micrarchaeota archaeon]
MHVYFIETLLSPEALAKQLPEKTIALKPELAGFPRFLAYTYSQTYKAFLSGSASATKFEVEWMCRIACTPQHAKAIRFCAATRMAALVSLVRIPKTLRTRFGKSISFALSVSAKQALGAQYGYSPEVLKHYALEDLLIEKTTVEFL